MDWVRYPIYHPLAMSKKNKSHSNQVVFCLFDKNHYSCYNLFSEGEKNMAKQLSIFDLLESPKAIINPLLRDYQIKAIADINQAWCAYNSVMLQMPTGTGKTTVFCEIMKQNADKKILVVVHRIELVHQIADRLAQFGLSCGIINADIQGDLSENIQVASIQTFSRRDKNKYPKFDLIIIDEAHHATAESYKRLWEIYPYSKFLGVTATPIRLSGEGFTDLFEFMITTPQIKEFIEMGYLCEVKQYAGYCPDLSGIKVSKGDYDTTELNNILDKSYIASLYKSYQRHALNKKVVIFCASVEHSREVAQNFKSKGVNICHLDATTKKDERDEILRKFKVGEITGISNVGIISEGFDVPDCEAILLAAPTKSISKYLQMVGRALRPTPDKPHAIILDCSNMYLELGLAVSNRKWTLEPTKEKRRKVEDFAMFRNGIITRVKPEEVEGIELQEIDEDLAKLVYLEDFIKETIKKGHKGYYAWYKYLDHKGSDPLSLKEFNYIKNRLVSTFKGNVNPGFFYYRGIELGLINAPAKKSVEALV